MKSIACGFCPKCSKGVLVPRKNSSNKELFFGCSSFPTKECNFTIDVDDYFEIATNYRLQHYNEIVKLNTSDHLFLNSEEALLSAIEIYNKPFFDYKFQTCIILIINAWELLMKAIICNKFGKSRIMGNDGYAINYCLEYCYEKGTHPKRKTKGFFVYSQKCYDEVLELAKKKID
ncbi:MAG: DUF3644 domain-containing protein [Christensenellales bacterium]